MQGLALNTFQVVLYKLQSRPVQMPATTQAISQHKQIPSTSKITVAVQGLALSTFQVVLVPTILGVLTNEFFPGLVKKLKPILPLIGVALTTLLCASPCAQVATILRWVPGRQSSALGSRMSAVSRPRLLVEAFYRCQCSVRCTPRCAGLA